jgi:DNA-binding response OmpR family regulator
MKVLVIDDDPLILQFIQRGLTEEGYTVDVASSGQEGAMFARMSSYDTIILDLMLPDMSGFDIVERLRAEAHSVPVLMLTARTGTDAKIQGLDAGADDFLTKPFDMGELKARLRALTRRGTNVRTEEVQIGSLTLDRMAHEVRLNDKRLKLTPKEYKLLEYFLLRPDTVVTRTDLLENVWDIHFDPGSNIVDAHVARMRSKLREAPGAPQLETVRGFGFRLVTKPSESED